MSMPRIFSAGVCALVWLNWIALVAVTPVQAEQATAPVIPRPAKMESRPGTFPLSGTTVIVVDKQSAATGEYLAEVLDSTIGIRLPVQDTAPSAANQTCIMLAVDPSLKKLGEEGYSLEVEPQRATMRGATAAGVFYACQTFRQLLDGPAAVPSSAAERVWTASCVRVEDRPRFPWRGLMLDPARHFLSKQFLRRYIDLLASYKLNRLHLHLTDCEAWTLDIKRYPELTDMKRWPMKLPGHTLGVYRQEDIREIVAYGASRHVMIVPEIETPGHSLIPVLIFREQLLCPNNTYRSGEKPWKNDDSIDAMKWVEPCLASPKAMEMYCNILKEVTGLFPSPYIHLGGDEYFGQAWEQCPDCRRLMETEKLRDSDSPQLKQLFANCLGSRQKYLLYRWWMTKMCDFVRAQGRRPVLWDDLSWRGKFPEGAVIMQWHYQNGGDTTQGIATPENPAAEAALAGRDAIVAPYSHLYFDLDSTLEAVYRLDLMPTGLPADRQARILGPHAPVWEQPEDCVDNRVFPRFYALAEMGWTPKEQCRWNDFIERLARHASRTVPVVGPHARGR